VIHLTQILFDFLTIFTIHLRTDLSIEGKVNMWQARTDLSIEGNN